MPEVSTPDLGNESQVYLHEVGHVIPPTATEGRGSNGVPADLILNFGVGK